MIEKVLHRGNTTITKLIEYLANENTLKGKNYYYFKRHYRVLKNREPNELLKALKVDETSALLRDLFDSSSE